MPRSESGVGTSEVPLRYISRRSILESYQPVPQGFLRKRQHVMDPEKLRLGREKLVRVFGYLEALNQHRNPAKRNIDEQPWWLWLRELPEHASVQRGAARPESSKTKDSAGSNSEEENAGYVLKVRRPRLTRAPEPPEEIAAWLEAGWDDPEGRVSLREMPEEPERKDGAPAARFGDDPRRTQVFVDWKVSREEWAEKERPARAAMRVFETLYSLYGRIEREGERVELVLGDGILSWQRAEGDIFHPILLQRLQLQFDASAPEFTDCEADHPVELYSALFQSMSGVDGRAIGRCREELEQEE